MFRSDSDTTGYREPLRDRLPGPIRVFAELPWLGLVLAVVAAVILANQFNAPNSRIIKLIAGMVLFGVAYRTRPFYSLCFITLLFPFPFSIFVGSSTMIFVVLASLIYLARLTLKQVNPLRRTPIDIGVGVMVACYLLSFYNIEDPVILSRAIVNLFAIFASFMLFYMTANFIRTENQLRTFVKVLAYLYTACIAVAMFELLVPNQPLIPHWILDRRQEQNLAFKGYRVAGPFYDYELFAEFMAMGFFVAFFLFRRAKHPNVRFFSGLLAVGTVFTLLLTVTRGAVIAFLFTAGYTLWLIRKRLRIRDFTMLLLVAVGGFLVMDFVIVNFTTSGSIVGRLLDTRFVGAVPDTRQHWPDVLARAMDHPFVGHGAYYDLGLQRGITGQGLYAYSYPHNLYLFYAHTVGFLGVAAFLFLTGRMLWVSFRERGRDFSDPSFPRAFMLVLHAMLVIFLIDQAKIEYLRNPAYIYFPWILLGTIAANYRIIREQRANRTSNPPPPDGP